jgi:hypothetical protein
MHNKTFWIGIVVVVLIVAGGSWYVFHTTPAPLSSSDEEYTQSGLSDITKFTPVAPGTFISSRENTNLQTADFSRIKFTYLRSGTSVYYVSHTQLYPMKSADFATFLILAGSWLEVDPYALDKNNAYYLGQSIAGADPKTFHMIDHIEYAADSRALYYQGTQVSAAVDLATLSSDERNNVQDKNYRYCAGRAFPLGTDCSKI